jgi:hypothetical protein
MTPLAWRWWPRRACTPPGTSSPSARRIDARSGLRVLVLRNDGAALRPDRPSPRGSRVRPEVGLAGGAGGARQRGPARRLLPLAAARLPRRRPVAGLPAWPAAAVPLLATLGAIAWLGERPSALALTGTALVVVATVITPGVGPLATIVGSLGPRLAPGLGWGAATAAFIGSYTLWDARAVALVGVPPLLYLWWTELLLHAAAGAAGAVAPRRPAPRVDRAPQFGVRHRDCSARSRT